MSFTCPFCETTSHHPMDDQEQYCNRCRVFLEEVPHVWVVWSFEHGAWWAPGRWGYTPELREAGRFTRREAEEIEREANIVAVNERAIAWVEAQRHGPPRSDDRPRFHVVPEHNHHGGDGWAIFDLDEQRVTGGWFADRIAAEQTAAVLNRSETS